MPPLGLRPADGGQVEGPVAPQPTAGRRRWIGALYVLASAVALALAARHQFYDLRVYRGALSSWVNGHGLYSFVMPPADQYGFTYPPFAALLLLPLIAVPLPVAEAAILSATAVAAVAVASMMLARALPRPAAPMWLVVGVATLLVLGLDASRETLALGQIDMCLFLLVAWDLLILEAATGRWARWAGVGIGLATAIKLAPAVFLAYLIVSGKRRPAVVAAGTAGLACLIGFLVAPHESWVFWTRAVWHTNRVGGADSITNQSVRGLLARLDLSGGYAPWWLGIVGILSVLWVVRVRRAVQVGDDLGGLALTGALMCLICPISWVHYEVFLIPALARMVAWAIEPATVPWRRFTRMIVAGLCYAVLASQVEQLWRNQDDGVVALIAANAYVWIGLILLVLLPLRPGQPQRRLDSSPVPPPAGAGPRPAGRRSRRRGRAPLCLPARAGHNG